MQVTVEISPENVIDAIRAMSLKDLEQVKNALVEREVYFMKYRKDKIENVMTDFEAEGYSEGFLADLERGLKNSSVYNENKRA